MPKTIDIVDEKNQLTGKQASIDHVLLNGLWHRGAHMVVCTRTGYVLVQKRSSNMRMHPGFLDISAGGFVDAGEKPEQTAVRELTEELGLRVPKEDLQLLAIKRKNHAWRSLRRHDRAYIYCYAVYLPDHEVDVSHLQTSEVEWAGFVTFARARRLVRLHHIKGLGRIEPLYGFYSSLLRASQRGLRSTR